MITYISILRGINVGAHKRIKMNVLKEMYEYLGFENVHTYLQSGNVIFSFDETDFNKLEEIISKQIEKVFGFQVPVIVLTQEKLQDIIGNNPFTKDETKDGSFLHITFLVDAPKEYQSKVLENKIQEGEAFHLTPNAIYLYCPLGYSSTKLNNGFLEKKLKVKATTRNWKTSNELLTLASDLVQ